MIEPGGFIYNRNVILHNAVEEVYNIDTEVNHFPHCGSVIVVRTEISRGD